MLLLGACSSSPPSDAVPAVASVLRIDGNKCSWFPDAGDLCPTISMKVFPKGGTPYEAEVKARIPQIHAARVQPGASLAVLVDHKNAARVFVDVAALALPPPPPPASEAR
ncbi:hypothetical protein AKJ09_02253 [Labilithrix luteola]|uniref:Uncharacterized protein n=1 Tax=Labilithrix luteola TaxID=1391654 RepID=A0A0K1PR49_9BACT|nr:hypothetical protein AKJ09_02253 [Labilithrix luteola]